MQTKHIFVVIIYLSNMGKIVPISQHNVIWCNATKFYLDTCMDVHDLI